MAREVADGAIENVYRIQIMNTGEMPHRYKLTVDGLDSIRLDSPDEIAMDGTSSRVVPARVRVNHGKGDRGPNKIAFELKAIDDTSLDVREKAVFFVPE